MSEESKIKLLEVGTYGLKKQVKMLYVCTEKKLVYIKVKYKTHTDNKYVLLPVDLHIQAKQAFEKGVFDGNTGFRRMSVGGKTYFYGKSLIGENMLNFMVELFKIMYSLPAKEAYDEVKALYAQRGKDGQLLGHDYYIPRKTKGKKVRKNIDASILQESDVEIE